MPPKYQTEHQAGDHNVQMMGMDIHSPVFFSSALLISLFALVCSLLPKESSQLLVAIRDGALATFDSFMMISVNVLLLFCLLLIVMPAGRVVLGGADAKPEFSRLSWFAMLFAAGMGIGLMFWGVAEPLSYFGAESPPLAVGGKTEHSAQLAMAATVYHWGFHAWAIYAIVGLALAYFSFNCRLPLTLRSAFYPLLKEKCWSWPGHLIDVFAVLATIFGLATSLGLGAAQVNSGLHLLFGLPESMSSKVVIITIITSIALVSVLRGLDGGIKVLSNANMVVAALILLFVAVAGPYGAFSAVFDTFSSYVEYIAPLSNWIDRPDEGWMRGWTVFYWAWWVSWSPFVGMFIARISRGRTIREFLLAVLVVPTLVTLTWMAIFGQNALFQVQNEIGSLSEGMHSISLATFQLLQSLPLSAITTVVGVLLIVVFFVTSADSGALVIDGITAGGKTNVPLRQRFFWTVMGGVLAAVLLYNGGSDALAGLQAGTVASGIPFTLVLLALMVSLSKGLGLFNVVRKQSK